METNKRQKSDDEKYHTSSSDSSYYSDDPIVEIINENYEYKIIVPMYIFKNTGSIKWNSILKEYIDGHQTLLTKIDKENKRIEYMISATFKKPVVDFVIDYLKSLDSGYDKVFLQKNWFMIFKLGEYWNLKAIMMVVHNYLLGSLMSYDQSPKSHTRIQSDYLIDNKVSTVGYEIYRGLLLESRDEPLADAYNPVCRSVYYGDNKIVRANSLDVLRLVRDIILFMLGTFELTDNMLYRYRLLLGFLQYIDKTIPTNMTNINVLFKCLHESNND